MNTTYIKVTYIRVDVGAFKLERYGPSRSAVEFAVAETTIGKGEHESGVCYRAVANAIDPQDTCFVDDGAVTCWRDLPRGVIIVKGGNEEQTIREKAIDTAVGRLIKMISYARHPDAIELSLQFIPNRRPRGVDPMRWPMWAVDDALLGRTIRGEAGTFGVQFEYADRDVDAGFKNEVEEG